MESYSLIPRVLEPSATPVLNVDLNGLMQDGVTEIDWLNSVLSNEEVSLILLDSELSKVLELLEITLHDTTSLVDRTIDEISRSIPRLSFDLQLMRENAQLLKFTLDGIRQRSHSNQKIGAVMEKLKELDLIKSRMEAARDVLREAESWSTLESEVTSLVGESSYSKAAERLEEASRSMVVFQNTTEYEGRRALMVSLQNQLEAALSTSLVTAINARDVKSCKIFYSIFTQIQRETEFTSYYFGSRRATLTLNWSKATLSDTQELPTTSETPMKFTSFLSKFYADLHSLLNEERNYIPAIFPLPSPTLSAFLQTTLEGLSPSLPQRLSAIITKYGVLALPEVITAYKATQEFSLSVERIMGLLGSEISDLPSTKSEKRLSKRMSIKRSSRSLSVSSVNSVGASITSEGGLRNWETAIFEPFLDWQVEYPQLEKKYLVSEMTRMVGGGSLLSGEKGAKLFGEQVTVGIGLVEDAIGRTLAFTHGYAMAEMMTLLDDFLFQFLSRKKEELDRGRLAGLQISKREEDGDELELEGLEYSSEDWGTFQFGLRLLDVCRGVSEKLTGLETRLQATLSTLASNVKAAKEDSSYTIPSTTRGGIILLRQSTLNSMSLASLLDPFESTTTIASTLLPRTKSALIEFTRSTQLFLQATILAPLFSNLTNYATLQLWSASPSETSGKGAFDLSIPTFSLSPTETISKVGEGLFSLPRLFEIYAEDDALGFSIETLPFIDINSLRNSLGPVSPITPNPRHSGGLNSMRKSSISNSIRIEIEPLQNLPPETLISLYLSSLTLTLLNHLTGTILPTINKLSKTGADQLISDLSYITNVARALDVEASDELDWWRAAVENEVAEVERKKEGREREIWERVKRIRR